MAVGLVWFGCSKVTMLYKKKDFYFVEKTVVGGGLVALPWSWHGVSVVVGLFVVFYGVSVVRR